MLRRDVMPTGDFRYDRSRRIGFSATIRPLSADRHRRQAPAPAPNPNADIDTTAALLSVNYRLTTVAKERNDLQNIFVRDFPNYAALSKPEPLTATEIRSLLDNDEALVVIDPGEKSYVWVVTTGRVAGQALLLLRDLLSPLAPPNLDMLRNLFGLTPAEAEVARAICGGVTKSSVAASRGLRESTVRTQVRSILAKTGTTNLRDLKRLLATLR